MDFREQTGWFGELVNGVPWEAALKGEGSIGKLAGVLRCFPCARVADPNRKTR